MVHTTLQILRHVTGNGNSSDKVANFFCKMIQLKNYCFSKRLIDVCTQSKIKFRKDTLKPLVYVS